MDKKELIKTAHLARLKLSEKEHLEFTDQLKVIFEYFKRISSIDTKDTLPLVYPLDGVESMISLREDKVQTMKEKKAELLDLAPERLGNEYKVPPVVD